MQPHNLRGRRYAATALAEPAGVPGVQSESQGDQHSTYDRRSQAQKLQHEGRAMPVRHTACLKHRGDHGEPPISGTLLEIPLNCISLKLLRTRLEERKLGIGSFRMPRSRLGGSSHSLTAQEGLRGGI